MRRIRVHGANPGVDADEAVDHAGGRENFHCTVWDGQPPTGRLLWHRGAASG